MRSQKWTKIGTPLPGYLVLKSVSGGPFLEHLLICAYGERRPETEGDGEAGRTLAPGGPEELNKRFAQKSGNKGVLKINLTFPVVFKD